MPTRSQLDSARPEELLRRLRALEQDLLRYGGVLRQRERRDMIQAAVRAGCSLTALADALDVTLAELRAWSGGGDGAGRRLRR